MHGVIPEMIDIQTSFAPGKDPGIISVPKTYPFMTAIIDPDWPYTAGPKKGRSGYTRYKDADRNIYKQDKPLSVPDLKALQIGDLVGGYLFMWTVGPFLIHADPRKQALPVLDAWGFKPVSILTWAKWNRRKNSGYGGVGSWFLGNAEFCIVAKRTHYFDGEGKRRKFPVQIPAIRTGWSSLIVEPKTRHSAKPDNVHKLCEECFPGPFLEVFGRRQYNDKWTVIGNEAPGHEGRDIRESMQELLS